MDMKTARERANLTQTELAQRIGSSQTTVNFIESGKKYPDARTRLTINRALKADIDWFVHPNAPLTDIERGYLAQIHERMVQNGEGVQETMKFLANQDNLSLRKLFKFAGVVEPEIEPLAAIGFDYGKRSKK